MCAMNEPWIGPHPLCAAQVERDCQAFAADVAAGKYDSAGYTPAERKAQIRRLQQLGRLF